MNYLRILIFSLVAYGGYYLSNTTLQLAFNNHLPVSFSLYGIHNIASGVAFFFVGVYAVVLSVNNIRKLPFPVGNGNKVTLFLIGLGVVVGVLLNTLIDSNLERQGYVQCTDLTTAATRFTKKVYAKSPQICEQLVKEKYGRD